MVKQTIKRTPQGAVITIASFGEIADKRVLVLVVNRLIKKGELKRLSKGKYYVPRESKFGPLEPSESSIIKSLLQEDNGSYISGLWAYNRLRLTTQLPCVITIVGKRYDRRIQIGNVKVKFVKKKTPIGNSYILQILDAINDLKKIPDTSTNEIISILKKRIQELSSSEKKS